MQQSAHLIPTLLMLSYIGISGFFCQWFAYKVKLPAILFLLIAGIILGPVTHILNPDALFGDLLLPYISLSVAVILFEGALTLRWRELDDIGKPVQKMVTFGVLISQLVVMLTTHYILGLSWELSALFGAIMVVTGPTVIMPMLKTVRPTTKVGDVLRWEGIIIDPIGALFAVLVYEWIVVQNTNQHMHDIAIVFIATIIAGAAIGLATGFIFGQLLKRHLIPEKIQNFAALSIVCFTFALSDALAHESGLLAVTVMGILLANMKGVNIRSILKFKEDLTVIFVSCLFIVLAARLDFTSLASLGWQAVLVFLAIQFLARPLKVIYSFWGSSFTWQERAMVAWIGPRGIVAAAITAVFALKLEALGIAQSELLVPLSFSIIIGTVIFQSLSARPVAQLLKVAQPNTHGIVIVGANRLSIDLAKALAKVDVQTLICDTNWDHISDARIEGLNTYYGNPSSDHANMHLDLSPYGVMMGLSSHNEYNVAQASHFKDSFGSRAVYVLPPNQDPDRYHKHLSRRDTGGQLLFNTSMSYPTIKKMINQGAKIKATELSEAFDYSQWQQQHPDAIALFTIDNENGDIVFATTEKTLKPEGDDILFSLVP